MREKADGVIFTPATAAIGIDVGGTTIKGLVANARGTWGPSVRRTSGRAIGRRRLVNNIIEVALDLMERARYADVTIKAIGIGLPGAVDPDAGVGKASANLSLRDFPIREDVQKYLGAPVFIEHDVYLGGLAEFTIGSAREDASSAFIPIGTGVGCAVMINRRIWRGFTRFAGEIGHINNPISVGECGCGRPGCLEVVASARGLERLYAARSSSGDATAKQIAQAARSGNTEAQAAWETCIDHMASMLAGLTLTVDVESIVVGGGLSEAGQQLMKPLESAVTRKLAPLRSAPMLRLSTFGDQSGARGAAIHALSQRHSRRSIATTLSEPQTLRPDIFMLALDHRTSLARDLFGTSALSSAQASQLGNVKALIAASAIDALLQTRPRGEISVLVDPEYGLGAAEMAREARIPVALALEKSGLRELSLLESGLLDSAIDRVGEVRWGKILVRWNPRDAEDRKAKNLSALEEARAFCVSKGIEFLLELIVPPTADDLCQAGGSKDWFNRHLLCYRIPEAVQELTRRIGPPNLWKVQGLVSPAACQAVAEAATNAGVTPPILVLGAASDAAQIGRWFRSSGSATAYRGFAIGRSIWNKPISDWLDGAENRNQTKKLITSRFLQYVDDYMITARIGPVGPGP